MNILNITCIFILTFSCALFAQPQALLQPKSLPESIKIKEGNAIFVDFQDAQYHLVYDFINQKVNYKATIRFYSSQSGYPIFDVIDNPKSIYLNQRTVLSRTISAPSKATTLRILEKSIRAGNHTMQIEGEITEDINFQKDGTLFANFLFNDQIDRSFLEKYLPTNLGYDQFSVKIFITQVGVRAPHVIYTNGKIQPLGQGTISIDYPVHFNTSSIYLHILPEPIVGQVSGSFTSKRTNKIIPITIYGIKVNHQSLVTAMNNVMRIISQLEFEIGPFPQEKLIVFLTSEGERDIDYAGAAIISELKNLRQQLFLQYLSKGYMPSNGNARWIGKALALWYDKNKPSLINFDENYKLANQSIYSRKIHKKASTHGLDFISYLHEYLIKNGRRGGLMPFLQYIAGNKINQLYTTETFVFEMEKFYKIKLVQLFKEHLY